MTNDGTLDPAVVGDLKELSDAAHPLFFREQIALFSARGRTLLAAILAAIESGDQERARAAAHAFGGSAATIGAARLHLVCRSLEEHAARWRTEDLLVLHEVALEAFRQAEGELELAAAAS